MLKNRPSRKLRSKNRRRDRRCVAALARYSDYLATAPERKRKERDAKVALRQRKIEARRRVDAVKQLLGDVASISRELTDAFQRRSA